jgi:hypothetical protein
LQQGRNERVTKAMGLTWVEQEGEEVGVPQLLAAHPERIENVELGKETLQPLEIGILVCKRLEGVPIRSFIRNWGWDFCRSHGCPRC